VYVSNTGIHQNPRENNSFQIRDHVIIPQEKSYVKLSPADLPKWFVHGTYYKCEGYLSAKGVVSMVYHPNLWINHFLRDDFLYVSYNEPITIQKVPDFPWEKFNGYGYLITGGEILEFLLAAREYSGYDITEIIEQIRFKLKILREKHPDYFNHWNFNIDDYFSQKIDSEKNCLYFRFSNICCLHQRGNDSERLRSLRCDILSMLRQSPIFSTHF